MATVVSSDEGSTEGSRFVGIITLEDVIRALMGEESIGETGNAIPAFVQ